MASIFPKREIVAGEIVLELRGVSNAVVRHVSLTLRKGEIFGIAGLVGSAHVQLAETIFGPTPADSGKIVLGGETVKITSPADDPVRHRLCSGGSIAPWSDSRDVDCREYKPHNLKNVAHGGLIDRR